VRDVRYGSLADILTSPRHVRFTPNNGAGSMHSSVSFLTLLTARLTAWPLPCDRLLMQVSPSVTGDKQMCALQESVTILW
jgi:hypothetical protein